MLVATIVVLPKPRWRKSVAKAYERDLVKQRGTMEYAEEQECRWKKLLDHFERGELESDRCGHCDRCSAAERIMRAIFVLQAAREYSLSFISASVVAGRSV